jgi:hypothetical protein
MAQVYRGVCTKQAFYETYLKRPEFIAWMLCPPTNYVKMAEETLAFGWGKMRDILEMPVNPTDKHGMKLAELQLKITLAMDMRVKGAVIQKNLNVNVNSPSPDVKDAVDKLTIEEMRQRIEKLRAEDRRTARVIEQASKPVRGEEDITDGELIGGDAP